MQIDFHEGQLEVYNSPATHKVLTLGRRWGKTYFARWWLILEAIKSVCPKGTSLKDSPVGYVAPTNKLAMQLMWRPLIAQLKEFKLLAADYKKDQIAELVNGRQIMLTGADNPDSLRGYSLGALCVDECKDVKQEVFEDSLLPATMDKSAPGLFLGTPPKGRAGYFFQMQQWGFSKDPAYAEWAAFAGSSWQNPTIPRDQLERAKKLLPADVYKREILGEFVNDSGEYFKADSFEIVDEAPEGGITYIATDFAGFSTEANNKRDDTVIAVVRITQDGIWYVLDMPNGKWDTRETALRLLKAYSVHSPMKIGGEVGALRNAVLPYIQDLQFRYNRHFEFVPLTHGGKRKIDRILWALQGRTHNKRIKLVRGSWNQKLLDQACDFPSPFSLDDLLDALAYIDQLSGGSNYLDIDSIGEGWDSWTPYDAYAGY